MEIQIPLSLTIEFNTVHVDFISITSAEVDINVLIIYYSHDYNHNKRNYELLILRWLSDIYSWKLFWFMNQRSYIAPAGRKT